MSDLLCHATTFYRAPLPTPITLQLVASRLNPGGSGELRLARAVGMHYPELV